MRPLCSQRLLLHWFQLIQDRFNGDWNSQHSKLPKANCHTVQQPGRRPHMHVAACVVPRQTPALFVTLAQQMSNYHLLQHGGATYAAPPAALEAAVPQALAHLSVLLQQLLDLRRRVQPQTLCAVPPARVQHSCVTPSLDITNASSSDGCTETGRSSQTAMLAVWACVHAVKPHLCRRVMPVHGP